MQNPPPSALLTLDLTQATHAAFQFAQQGGLPIVDLFTVTGRLTAEGQIGKAIELYRLWLDRTPSPIAYAVRFNLGVTLSNLVPPDNAGAEQCYRASIAQKPDFIEAHLNLGTLMERLGNPEEALSLWRAVLTFGQPDHPADQALTVQALNNLGRLLEIRKQLEESEQMLQRSLLLDPKQPHVITHLVHIRQKQCEWPVYRPLPGLPPEEMMDATSALAMLSASDDPARQLAASVRFVKEKVLSGLPPLAPPNGYRHKKLRVGYLSSDFCSHAVSILTAELYELHDRERIEVYGFCWSNEDGTPLRARVVRALDNYIRIKDMSDEQAAHCIRAHEIDILVDLHGLTLGTRPNILSHRPAPVQLTYLGFPGSTGLPEIDYVIADRFVLPPELEPHFSEKPLHMSRTFQINDRQRAIGAKPTRAACGLPENGFVYCSFNNNFKFTEEVFDVWMRILKRVPDSVLWIVADSNNVRENLGREAEARGVAKERLLFAARVTPADYLARYQVADLFLDTSPFNAGTTASDALWAGLPLLTCVGRCFSARMAGSLLHAVDLPELVTHNFQDYEDKAVSLAADPQRIEAMKRQLVETRTTNALFDSPAFVREMEDLLIQTARHPAEGEPDPEPFHSPYGATPGFPALLSTSPAAPAPDAGNIHLYQIAYSNASLAAIQPGFLVLNNMDNPRPDWREYWPIRRFLLGTAMNENDFYGFFSPKLDTKVGLTHSAMQEFVRNAPPGTNVLTFSPQPDMGAFFLNVFEQNDLFDPGFIAASEAFFAAIGRPAELRSIVMDSRQVVFSNFFVAKPAFWRAWLDLNEKLFAICEGPDNPVKASFNFITSYEDVPRKVFLMERLASYLLATDPQWKVKTYSTFACAWSATGMNNYKHEAVLSDALKIAMREHGLGEYVTAFANLRDTVFKRNR